MTEPWLNTKSLFTVHGSVSFAWVLFPKLKIWTTTSKTDPYNFYFFVF